MAFWAPHTLSAHDKAQLELKRGARVRATRDLPGVPAGTQGRVILVGGFNWLRYRVRFDNGVELGSLDAKSIEAA